MLRSMSPRHKRLASSLIVLVVSLGLMASSAAHDVPDEIIVQAFVKPEGERLHLLLRLPLALLLNLDLPKQGPGYLDLAHIDEALQAAALVAAQEFALFEDDRRLNYQRAATRISLPSDTSFSSYAQALAHLKGPKLPIDTTVFWNQGFFDAHIEYPIASDQAAFSLQVMVAPGLGERLKSMVRFLPAGGSVRAYQLVGDLGRVALDPRWHQAAWTFVQSGFHHILGGMDHLLFLFCLVIPIRRLRSLVIVVTSFTVAHSMTLVASTYGVVPSGEWFPPLVETLIAASIFYMAIENIVSAKLARRWFIAFAFGLVHGFGFSFALQESLQFSGSHLLLSLLSFNIGVEVGQILVVALLVPALGFFFRQLLSEWLGTILLSVIVAHSAWHWMTERAAVLRGYEIPVPDSATLSMLAAGMVLLLLIGGGLGLLTGRWFRPAHEAVPDEEHLPEVL